MKAKMDKTPKKDRSKSEEDKLDDALDDTFPASDPPAMTQPHRHPGSGKQQDEAGHKHEPSKAP